MEKVRKRQSARRGFMDQREPPNLEWCATLELSVKLSRGYPRLALNTQLPWGSVLGRWADIIGAENAEHCKPESLKIRWW